MCKYVIDLAREHLPERFDEDQVLSRLRDNSSYGPPPGELLAGGG